MNRNNLLLATITVAFVAGCASTPMTNSAARALDDKPRLTGSRLSNGSVKSIRSQQEIIDVMQRGNIVTGI